VPFVQNTSANSGVGYCGYFRYFGYFVKTPFTTAFAAALY